MIIRFEQADINDPSLYTENSFDANGNSLPLLLVLGYTQGVQVWLIPGSGEAKLVLSLFHGQVKALRILPTPTARPNAPDLYSHARPLVVLCDSAGPGAAFMSVSFVSLLSGEQVGIVEIWHILFSLRQHLRRCHNMSPPTTHFWKWSDGVEKSEMDLFWCISMTNNVYSCKKINGRAQTFKFSVFTMGRQELLAKNMKELRKLGKLKRLFLNFFKYYDPPRVAPCERAWPGLSENV
jgi:hypothetical protein